MSNPHDRRAPMAAHMRRSHKRRTGPSVTSDTPVEIRSLGGAVDDALCEWVYQRLGRQLGKFATQIERIEVRFGDENGPKGGVDRACLVHVHLSALPHVTVEMRSATDRKAFDLAASRVARATRDVLDKHGYAFERKVALGAPQATGRSDTPPATGQEEPATAQPRVSLYGRREGRAAAQLRAVSDRPEKRRRDEPIDTAQPGVSADARSAGYGHSAKRNTKRNTAGMVHALEDSASGKPSRKSTRRGKNRVKPEANLTLRSRISANGNKRARTRRGR